MLKITRFPCKFFYPEIFGRVNFLTNLKSAAGCWFSWPDGDALTTGPWLAKHTQNKVSKIVLSCLWC